MNVRCRSRVCENVDITLFAPYDSPVLWREGLMKRFVEGVDRGQSTLFPDCLEDWIGDDNPVRASRAGDFTPTRSQNRT